MFYDGLNGRHRAASAFFVKLVITSGIRIPETMHFHEGSIPFTRSINYQWVTGACSKSAVNVSRCHAYPHALVAARQPQGIVLQDRYAAFKAAQVREWLNGELEVPANPDTSTCLRRFGRSEMPQVNMLTIFTDLTEVCALRQKRMPGELAEQLKSWR
jgi:hypothetical protein